MQVDVYKNCQWNSECDSVCFLWVMGQCFYYDYCQDGQNDYYDYKVGYQCDYFCCCVYFFFNQFVK